jgi:hypothetical protein
MTKKQTIRQVLEDLKEIAPGWANELSALEGIDDTVEVKISATRAHMFRDFSNCIVGEAHKDKKWSYNYTPYNCLACAEYGDGFVDSVYPDRHRHWFIDPSEFWLNLSKFIRHFKREHKKEVYP